MAANAFTLFGELAIDSSKFQSGLKQADAQLQGTLKRMQQVEKAAANLGRAQGKSAKDGANAQKKAEQDAHNQIKAILASTNRAKQQQAQLGRAVGTVISAANRIIVNSEKAVERATAQVTREMQRAETAARRKAAAFQQLGSKVSGAGDNIKQFGSNLSQVVTVPLAAFGTLAFASATKVDALRNSLTAATGSVEEANAKISHFLAMAQKMPGVFAASAARLYAAFKPMGVGDTVIDQIIEAFGRLQTAEANFDPDQFRLNLSQLFGQNFEMQDLKQALTFFPRFGQLVAQQFGFEGSDLATVQKGFQRLKEQGLMSYEDFIKGIALAVNNDPTFGKLRETLGNRFAKLFERLTIALEPIGRAIADILEPALTKLVSLVESLGQAFAGMSPAMQTAVVAFGLIAAAVGPLVMGLASIVIVIGGAIKAFTFVAASIGTLTAAIGPAIVAIVAFSAAFIAVAAVIKLAEGNFGGLGDAIRDFSTEARKQIEIFAYQFQETMGQTLDEVRRFWEKHKDVVIFLLNALGRGIAMAVRLITDILDDLRQDLVGLTTALRIAIGLTLGILDAFVSAVKSHLTAFRLIWNKEFELAAQYMLQAMQQGVEGLARVLALLPSIVLGALMALFPSLDGWAQSIISFFERVGADIPAAIARGIYNNASLVSNAVNYMKSLKEGPSFGDIAAKNQQQSEAALRMARSAGVGVGARPGGGGVPSGGRRGGGGGARAEINPFIDALNDLEKTLALVTAQTEKQRFEVELLMGRYKDLKVEEKDRLRVINDTILRQEEINDKIDTFNSLLEDLQAELSPSILTMVKLNEVLKDPTVRAALGDLNIELAKVLATMKDLKPIVDEIKKSFDVLPEMTGRGLGEGLGLGVEGGREIGLEDLGAPPPDYYRDEWDKFFRFIQGNIGRIKEELPSMGEALANVATMSLESLGSIFGNALAEWDGTLKGFFRSVALGFQQLAQEIIRYLMQVMIMKLIVGLTASSAGGKFLSSNAGTLNGSTYSIGNYSTSLAAGAAPSFASGGLIKGPGSGVSDSIPAMLSNGEFVMPAEVVKKLGVGFFESLREMKMPRPIAMADGGFLGTPSLASLGPSVSNSNMNNTFNFSFGAQANPQQTASMVQRNVIAALRREERRNR